MIATLVRRLYCRLTYHQAYSDRGVAACLRCGRRWVGRSYD